MNKQNPLLGKGDYTLMRVINEETQIRGLAIVNANRFKTFGEVGEEVDILHIESIDDEKDIAIYFTNLEGVDALLLELTLLREDIRKDNHV